MKKVYSYDPTTRVHIDTQPADPDELETAKGEGEVWLLPAYATFTEPGTPSEGQVSVYDLTTDTWAIVVADAVEEGAESPPDLALQIAVATRRVDQDVDAVIFAVIGNRATEYLQAEQEATAYLAAVDQDPNTDDVPPAVASDAEAFGHTPIEAAESILAQAAAWRGASNSMRASRLMHKQLMLKAGDPQTLGAALESWNTFIAGMRQALGV